MIARRVTLLLILGVAAFLRVRGIGEQSLWADEGLTVRILRLPVGEMLGRIREWEQTPPLYYFLLKIWTTLLGDSERVLRLPSAIFGVASVGMLYIATRRVFGTFGALLAAALLALSPYHVAFSQEARAYSLFILLTIISCDLFLRLLERRTPRLEFLWLLVTALLLYTHLYSFFVVAAQNLAYGAALISRRPRGISILHWMRLNLGLLIVYIPWMHTLSLWIRSVRAGFWVPPMTLDAIAGAYEAYAGSWILLVVMVALAVVAAWRVRDRAAITLFAAIAVLPVVVPVIISVLTRPTFVPRYGTIASIGLITLAAVGVSSIRSVAGRVAASILLIALTLFPTTLPDLKPQWREAGAFLNANMNAGDFAAVHRKGATCMYDYYAARPDVTRIGFDGSALPVSQPLPAGKHVWLVLYTDLYPARRFIERGRWRVGKQKAFREVLVIELIDDLGETN